jgi:hypothetical protein
MATKTQLDQFVESWHRHRSPVAVAKELGINVRKVYERRALLAKKGIYLETVDPYGRKTDYALAESSKRIERRRELALPNGSVVVFSDAHFWPGRRSPAFDALLKVIKKVRPKLVIGNGDLLDGASISSHPPLGWDNLPPLVHELEEVVSRMQEIAQAAKGSVLLRTQGNHDLRFDRKLAVAVPQFRGVKGFSLGEHLPQWPVSWSILINERVFVKHRWHNGQHAAFNNVVKSGGLTVVTGHLHKLMVAPWGDPSLSGRTWGVDTGTLAEPGDDRFEYTEDSPTQWASGFAVLTFKNGKLLPPELCEVLDGEAYFRGQTV